MIWTQCSSAKLIIGWLTGDVAVKTRHRMTNLENCQIWTNTSKKKSDPFCLYPF